MKVSSLKNKNAINVLQPLVLPATVATPSETALALSKKIKPERSKRVTGDWERDVKVNLPDTLVFKRHRELLNARVREVIVVGQGFAREVKVVDLGPDTSAVAKGLELAYKAKGKIAGDQEPKRELPAPILQQFNINISTDKE